MKATSVGGDRVVLMEKSVGGGVVLRVDLKRKSKSDVKAIAGRNIRTDRKSCGDRRETKWCSGLWRSCKEENKKEIYCGYKKKWR